ncbi:hypothetical protein MIND_00047500 [Mycena indigotica]|uniref:Uncharacterized protein n=1 Tax=Mycena indigotica TaxID=2126181 RepID=A0A8H6WE41_9AGAR|nr:uncharacterized protein MIND_00047500 [Mycena indigotica]KAF7315329.1 hypothetical protein MIND_00047500 [Mycena indigotica]
MRLPRQLVALLTHPPRLPSAIVPSPCFARNVLQNNPLRLAHPQFSPAFTPAIWHSSPILQQLRFAKMGHEYQPSQRDGGWSKYLSTAARQGSQISKPLIAHALCFRLVCCCVACGQVVGMGKGIAAPTGGRFRYESGGDNGADGVNRNPRSIESSSSEIGVLLTEIFGAAPVLGGVAKSRDSTETFGISSSSCNLSSAAGCSSVFSAFSGSSAGASSSAITWLGSFSFSTTGLLTFLDGSGAFLGARLSARDGSPVATAATRFSMALARASCANVGFIKLFLTGSLCLETVF